MVDKSMVVVRGRNLLPIVAKNWFQLCLFFGHGTGDRRVCVFLAWTSGVVLRKGTTCRIFLKVVAHVDRLLRERGAFPKI